MTVCRQTMVRAFVAALSAAALGQPAIAADYETFTVNAGESIDVYWSVNLSGWVYVQAVDEDGAAACLDYWWIVYPFTNIKQLGNHCGATKFELPGISDWAVGGKLRAGGATARTTVYGTADETVAHQFPPIEF